MTEDFTDHIHSASHDPFERVSEPKDQLFFRLGFQAALRVCELAHLTIDSSTIDADWEG